MGVVALTPSTGAVTADTSEESASAYSNEMIADTYNRPPAGEVNSYVKAKIDNCVPVHGCISASYPWVRVRAGNEGRSIGGTRA